jgi:hypothetical protein
MHGVQHGLMAGALYVDLPYSCRSATPLPAQLGQLLTSLHSLHARR